jgi:cytochrome c oxidase assembly factor CtaG
VQAGVGGAWAAEPAVLAGAALALFAQGFRRLRRRGGPQRAPLGRAVVFLAAVALAVLALVSPLDAIGERELLSAHMLQHVVVGDLVPALLAVSLRGPLLLVLLPAPALRSAAGLRPLRAAARLLLRPAVSLGVWLATFAAWHVPAAYDSVLGNPVLHDLEHVTFMLAGILVWVQLVDPGRRNAPSDAARYGIAVVLFAAAQGLANTLVFAPHPLYAAYAAPSANALGLSPASDQAAAGLVMMTEMLLTVGTWTALRLRAHFRAPLALAEAERHPLAL